MKIAKLSTVIIAAAVFAACEATANNTIVSNANTNGANITATPSPQNLAVVDPPKNIKDMMAQRGEQDKAQPKLQILEPKANATISSSTVSVKLSISGDLKGYKPHMDPATKMGNHIHVILDNQPYEAYYNLDQAFELRNVADGEHTLRVFPSRPWHESYKNEGAFQMVKFTVKNGGADTSKPATTNTGQQLTNTAESNTNGEAAATPEGKDMQKSTAGAVDSTKPLLTYSRPKGEYKGTDADPIMIDFWLANAKLTGDGGTYLITYTIDGGEPRTIEKWAPIWISGLTPGKHTIKLELIDGGLAVVDNGGYNSTTREFTVTK